MLVISFIILFQNKYLIINHKTPKKLLQSHKKQEMIIYVVCKFKNDYERTTN